jgi:hypothetical protein
VSFPLTCNIDTIFKTLYEFQTRKDAPEDYSIGEKISYCLNVLEKYLDADRLKNREFLDDLSIIAGFVLRHIDNDEIYSDEVMEQMASINYKIHHIKLLQNTGIVDEYSSQDETVGGC